MSRDGSITLDWADGTYTFRLGWGQWELLQESCGCGPWYLQALFFNAAIMVQNPEGVRDLQPKYIAEVIRAGLIGGGMTPVDALKKIRAYVHDRPPRENFPIAVAIIQAGLDGAPDEDGDRQKKSEEAMTTDHPSPGAKSDSPKSMEPAAS